MLLLRLLLSLTATSTSTVVTALALPLVLCVCCFALLLFQVQFCVGVLKQAEGIPCLVSHLHSVTQLEIDTEGGERVFNPRFLPQFFR